MGLGGKKKGNGSSFETPEPSSPKVKWLDKQLSKMWPFIVDVAIMVIRESVEPLLEDYRPPGITSLKFRKLAIRKVAPKIEGIRVQSLNKELKPQGKISVTVVRGNNLKNMEMLGKSDPYMVLSIRLIFKVKTKDVGQDKLLGVAKLPLIELIPGTPKEIDLRLLPSLDMLKIKDKKDRGTLTLKVLYHQFSKEEQLATLEVAKRILEEKKKMKEAGMIGSMMDALDGVASLVGSGVGLVDMELALELELYVVVMVQ
ncbi:hypothetical protein GIB67_036380 [Kingdonia uniflora]|uniref:C2 domain-containing protein n=1 Tax=Kingdonia uniflora TaxID=39325 RepID=A0A7J7L426_9MAGN|nr:hypothetical protein GIB67_036380 [Kingdonia uniflora]